MKQRIEDQEDLELAEIDEHLVEDLQTIGAIEDGITDDGFLCSGIVESSACTDQTAQCRELDNLGIELATNESYLVESCNLIGCPA